MRMQNSEHMETYAFVLFMLLFISTLLFAVFQFVAANPGTPMDLPAAEPRPHYATDNTWRSDAPPAGEPVIGIWYDGWEPRAHVVVMVMGAAYPYRLGGEAVAAVEHDAPLYWRRLP
jgi:hypothetical protein